MIRAQHHIHLNTRAKEIQQLSPDGPDKTYIIKPQSKKGGTYRE